MVMNPERITKSAIIIKPSTLLTFHQALVKKKYQRLFGSVCKNKPGPKGPRDELVKLVLEIKKRNPSYGCPRIALLISNRFGIHINKDVVRRILALHYNHQPPDFLHPSWLALLGNMKDSLWSIDLFRCESMTLNSYWVLIIMDQWSRRIIGFRIHKGPVDGPALCRMFNDAVAGDIKPKCISTDHDPLFKYFRWRANLRILDIHEIKTVPFTPISHPFIERLIGTIRRECLDQTFFWNSLDLQRKLDEFTDYYNQHRVHSSLDGKTPEDQSEDKPKSLLNFDVHTWKSHCGGLYQTPVPV